MTNKNALKNKYEKLMLSVDRFVLSELVIVR